MENYFLVTTSTNEKWEMMGGQYIVQAENPEKAGNKVKEMINEDQLFPGEEVIYIQNLETERIKEVFVINRPIY